MSAGTETPRETVAVTPPPVDQVVRQSIDACLRAASRCERAERVKRIATEQRLRARELRGRAAELRAAADRLRRHAAEARREWLGGDTGYRVTSDYLPTTIVNTPVPQFEQVPFRPGRPFFIVMCCGLFISTFFLHLTQYASALGGSPFSSRA